MSTGWIVSDNSTPPQSSGWEVSDSPNPSSVPAGTPGGKLPSLPGAPVPADLSGPVVQTPEEIVQQKTGITPYSTPAARAAAGPGRVIRGIVTSPASAFNQLFHGPENDEEQQAQDQWGPLGLGFERNVVEPAEKAHRTASEFMDIGHPLLAVGAELGAIPILGPMGQHLGEEAAAGDPEGAVTEGLTQALLPKASEKIGPVKDAIQEAAMGDADAAALRGLGVGPKSPNALSMLKSVRAARPYLQGVQDLEELQDRIPIAKREIWQPYEDTISAIGNKPVMGPDGPTTILDLEKERLQTSALLRGVRSRSPEAIQLAQQKGLTESNLMDRDAALKASLDPHLQAAGIDPKGIRSTFGHVSNIGSRISGKSTLIEEPQRYGLGKAGNLSITNPLRAPGEIASGVRDIAAGRPLLQGKPTDINIREAFREGGAKPNLGQYRPHSQFSSRQPQLQANVPGNAPYGAAPMTGGTIPARPSVITPPPAAVAQLPAEAGPEGAGVPPAAPVNAPPSRFRGAARFRVNPTEPAAPIPARGPLVVSPEGIYRGAAGSLPVPKPTLALPEPLSTTAARLNDELPEEEPIRGRKAEEPAPLSQADEARYQVNSINSAVDRNTGRFNANQWKAMNPEGDIEQAKQAARGLGYKVDTKAVKMHEEEVFSEDDAAALPPPVKRAMRETGTSIVRNEDPSSSRVVASVDPNHPNRIEVNDAQRFAKAPVQTVGHEATHVWWRNLPPAIQKMAPADDPKNPFVYSQEAVNTMRQAGKRLWTVPPETMATIMQRYSSLPEGDKEKQSLQPWADDMDQVPLSAVEPTDSDTKGINTTPRAPEAMPDSFHEEKTFSEGKHGHPAGEVTAWDEETGLPIVKRKGTNAKQNGEKERRSAPDKTAGGSDLRQNPEEKRNIQGPKEGKGRDILHASTDREALVKGAKQHAPVLEKSLRSIASSVPGAHFDAVRDTKDPKRLDQKINEEGQPINTIPDLLAGRIAVDTPEARTGIVDGIKKAHDVIREEDEFEKGSPGTHYRVHKLQVKVSPEMSAEVHVVPKEGLAINDDQHEDYEDAEEAKLDGDKVAQKEATAKARDANDKAMSRFQRRNAGETGSKSTKGGEAKPTERAGASGEHPAASGFKVGDRVMMPTGKPAIVAYAPSKNAQLPTYRFKHDDGSTSEMRANHAHSQVKKSDTSAPDEDEKGTIDVDLDKTLSFTHGPTERTHIGAPQSEMVDRIKKDLAAGKKVKIFTARVSNDPDGKVREAIQNWSKKHLGVALDVTDKKTPDVGEILDDKARRVKANTGKVEA